MYAIFCGLPPMIPIPFIDDWALRSLKRQQFKRIFADKKKDLDLGEHSAAIHTLACGVKESFTCVGCFLFVPNFIFKKIILYTIKKIIKKLIFVLSMKDAVDVSSHSFHEACLFRVLLNKDYLNEKTLADENCINHMRRSMEKCCEEHETKPVEKIIVELFNEKKSILLACLKPLVVLIKKARRIGKDIDEQDLHVDEIMGLSEILANKISENEGYIDKLECHFIEIYEASLGEDKN